MIRDEKGFLSEFTAYYQIHGIDHILFFDHNSADQSQFIELKPWIDNGFVSIISSFSTQTLGGVTSPLPTSFDEIMRLKILTEVYCKQYGVNMGFEYFFSVDVDEYIIPLAPKTTLVDAFERLHKTIGVNYIKINKFNYVATPHLLEPVDLLTIEAYQVSAVVQ